MKNTIRILFTVILAVFMCVGAFALTLDTAEAAETVTTPEADAALAEVTFTAAPGLNYFTGTEQSFDFEDADISTAIVSGMVKDGVDYITVGSVPDTIVQNTYYGNAMIVHRPASYDWFHIKYNNFSFDGTRPYYYAMDTYYAFEGTPTSSWMAFVYAEKNASGGDFHYTVTTSPNAWATQSFNKKTPKNGWKVDLQISMSENGQGKGSAHEVTTYVDNMILVPYYKVTYMNADGTEELASEYVLFDNGGLILKEYTPNSSIVSGVTGYSLSVGGERVGTVALNNEDIVLYAVETDEASFVAGGETVNVAATSEEYTLPTPEELGLTVENFRFWTDGTNDYFAGAKLDSGLAAGVTYKAVCFEPEIFDPYKGDLVYFVDMEDASGYTDPTYINKAYTSGLSTRTDGALKISRYKDPADGNAVVRLANDKTSPYQLFGYRIERSDKSVGGKATVTYDFKYVTAATEYAKGGVWMRMLHTDSGAEEYQRTNMTLPSDRIEGTWYPMSVSYVDTGLNGLTGAIFQYEGLPKDKNMIQYIDNFAYYVYPAKTFALLAEEGSEEFTRVTAEGDTYTMPETDLENAVAWTDGKNFYLIGEAYNVADLQFKTLYPFCQDADMPAMISLYEDGVLPSSKADKFKYYENIDDDGRNVLHFHQWATSWHATNGWMNDARIHMFVPNNEGRFDASEYEIISIMLKKTSAYVAANAKDKETTYTSATASNATLYNYTNAGHSYAAQSHIGSFSTPVDSKYHNIEINMATRPNATYPWETTGYGFALDPNTVSYGGDTYIDYVRVYRKGIFTVTYNTNAPVGATVVSEVAADTNRGLGTGYLLKDERPVVDGYIFMGWATAADSTEVVTSIDVDGNETVYAVWEKAETKAAPAMTAEVEIKGTGANNGIRFKASIMPSVKENLDEFGFIATREVLLPVVDAEEGTYDYTALTHLLREKGPKNNYFVEGIAYDADGDIDLINGDGTDGSIIYTVVVSGIPLENKNETMVVRSYAKFNINGKEMTVYSDAKAASLYETALAIKNADGEAYANNKTYIDSVLAETAE